MDRTLPDHTAREHPGATRAGTATAPAEQGTEAPVATEPCTARAATAAPGGPAAGSCSPVGMRRLARSLVWDVGLPVLGYYAARAAGCDEYLAMLAGTLIAAARTLLVAVRHRRLDPFAAFLMVIFGIGLALTLLTGDPRFMLVKQAVTGAVAGLVFLGSCLVHRPLTRAAALRFADPEAAARIRAGWAEPAGRRPWYVSSLVWGVGLLLESVLRVGVVYLLPFDVAVGASTALEVAAFALLIGWTVRFGKAAPATRS
ncbi:MAG TPA: VC0807 family protein [Pseudonocardia sp.]|jgi:hypothetical protein